MSHPDDPRNPAETPRDPTAAKSSSWRFWAALVPDHPVWAGRPPLLGHPPELDLATADEGSGDVVVSLEAPSW